MNFSARVTPIVMLAVLSAPVSALAHAHLVSANPAPNAVLIAPPVKIKARFSEPLVAAFSSLDLATAKGQPVKLGKALLSPGDAHEIVAGVTQPLTPGDYVVSWRAVSADTHKTSGQYSFHVKP